jgi:hypothetical protein
MREGRGRVEKSRGRDIGGNGFNIVCVYICIYIYIYIYTHTHTHTHIHTYMETSKRKKQEGARVMAPYLLRALP